MVADEQDDELVRRTAAGDKAAFTRLVARHQPRLVALVTRTLGNRSAAEDVVQVVLTRAWINAPTWQARSTHGGSYAGWLSRVALNLAIDQKRKPVMADLEGVPEAPDPTPTAESGLIDREAARRVRSAIAELPERQRMALSLTYDAELSNAEGATAMGTSVGAFELLLVRARRSLRQALADPDRTMTQ